MLSDDQLLKELLTRFNKNKEDLELFQRLTSELKEVNKKLAESEAHKSHFISHITNEINNPFTSILGLSKNITEMRSGSEDKMREMATLIYDEAYVLDFQLKNVFAAAKIEAGSIFPHYSRTEISGMLKRVVSSVEHLGDKLKVGIELSNELENDENGNCYIFTDAEKLEAIFVNLCNNAIKFSDPGQDVIISAKLIDDDHVDFSFHNIGKSLSVTERQEMFDRFKRLEDNINSINPGQGLGLSVAKAYAQILESDILVDSDPEKGNTFTVRLLLKPMEEGDSVTEADGYELFSEDEELF